MHVFLNSFLPCSRRGTPKILDWWRTWLTLTKNVIGCFLRETIGHYYSCVPSYLAYECKRGWRVVSIRTSWFTQQKQWGLYQNKINSSLAASQRPGARFSNVPKSFRTRKAIAKSRTLWLQSCFIHVFLIWSEVVFLHTRSFRRTHLSVLDTDERKMAFRAWGVSGLSRNGPLDRELETVTF